MKIAFLWCGLLLFTGCHFGRPLFVPTPEPVAQLISPQAPYIPLGASLERPIPMSSVLASMNYLDRLAWSDGTPVYWKRIDAVKRAEPLPPAVTIWEKTQDFLGLRSIPGPIIDCYLLSGKGHPEQRLWINPYASENYTPPPAGFTFIQKGSHHVDPRHL